MPAGFHRGGDQLQWFATAQPWNVHRVIRKNDQETTNFEMALHGGVAARCPPHHSTSHSLTLLLSLLSSTGVENRVKPHGLGSACGNTVLPEADPNDTVGTHIASITRVSVWVAIITMGLLFPIG